MRLSQENVTALVESISLFSTQPTLELRLYGSRVNDALKGGDIDLLLLTPDNITKDNLNHALYKILAEMKFRLGDRRIDLMIRTLHDLPSDPFLSLVYPTSILLKRWE